MTEQELTTEHMKDVHRHIWDSIVSADWSQVVNLANDMKLLADKQLLDKHSVADARYGKMN